MFIYKLVKTNYYRIGNLPMKKYENRSKTKGAWHFYWTPLGKSGFYYNFFLLDQSTMEQAFVDLA